MVSGRVASRLTSDVNDFATVPTEMPGEDGPKGVPGGYVAASAVGLGPRFYLMRLMMLNMGMYSDTTMPPTATPITAIKTGSMSDVSASTVASTSWS